MPLIFTSARESTNIKAIPLAALLLLSIVNGFVGVTDVFWHETGVLQYGFVVAVFLLCAAGIFKYSGVQINGKAMVRLLFALLLSLLLFWLAPWNWVLDLGNYAANEAGGLIALALAYGVLFIVIDLIVFFAAIAIGGSFIRLSAAALIREYSHVPGASI